MTSDCRLRYPEPTFSAGPDRHLSTIGEIPITQPGSGRHHTNASVLLDLIRALAALVVLFEHWRNFFFVDFHEVVTHRLLLFVPYVLSAAGHQAVIIFFVLSGYLVGGSVFRMLERGTWTWTTYLTHRLIRLWVVLLPGLLLCYFWDSFGVHLHLAPALYAGDVPNHMLPHTPTIKSFFENLFFLQGILGPQFGSDGALWSLANEFWYYILFPLGALVVYRSSKIRTSTVMRASFALAFVAIAWLLRDTVLSGFPIWMTGALLYRLPTLKLSTRYRVLAAVVYVPIFFALAHVSFITGISSDYLLTVFTFFFFWIILSATGPATPSLAERATRTVAGFSYTLYVVHMPFLLILTALAAGTQRWVPDPRHVGIASSFLVLAMVYAYTIATLTEFRTDTWRRKFETWLKRPAHPASLPSQSSSPTGTSRLP
ncbi:acyltransferase family protein [Granulicella arctica]|uniref:acyltransferase family protein n=1 Tax=Granulicella arctica TaxID=940613 RepID=UPI0021E05F92|nr:acyltransferase [Granulicella arctica]